MNNDSFLCPWCQRPLLGHSRKCRRCKEIIYWNQDKPYKTFHEANTAGNANSTRPRRDSSDNKVSEAEWIPADIDCELQNNWTSSNKGRKCDLPFDILMDSLEESPLVFCDYRLLDSLAYHRAEFFRTGKLLVYPIASFFTLLSSALLALPSSRPSLLPDTGLALLLTSLVAGVLYGLFLAFLYRYAKHYPPLRFAKTYGVGGVVNLNVVELRPQLAEALVACGADLVLDKVTSITPAVARILGRHKGKLSLASLSLSLLTKEAREDLVRCTGEIRFRDVTLNRDNGSA